MSDKALFDAVRAIKGTGLTDDDVAKIKAALVACGIAQAAPTAAPPLSAPASTATPGAGAVITLRGALELVTHEAIVQEAYKDSVGVWTWGVGVTSKSGHQVERYKDTPQPIERCLAVYIWLLRTNYAPDVLKAFAGRQLTEEQFTAALSFHYNTGAILRADWVKSWLAGNADKARAEIMNWRSPPEILERRGKERDLFFDGRWAGDGKCLLYPVRKPSYAPDWGKVRRIDVSGEMQAALEGEG